MRPLAAGLDPVWVARVSRPPVGVCCDHVRFDCEGMSSGPPLTPADLDAFEAEHELTLPTAYRAFLLNRNGGYPYPQAVRTDDDDPQEWPRVESFLMVGPVGWEEDEEARIPAPIQGVNDDPFGERGRMLPFVDDGGVTACLLGVDGPNAGAVFHHTDPVHAWDEFPVIRLAGSLGEFLSRLAHTDPEWAQAIIRDELPALTAWLDGGGDPNAEDPENEWHPLEYAVQWNRRAATRLLIDRGATVTETAWEVADRMDDAEIKAMVKAVCPKKPGRKKRR